MTNEAATELARRRERGRLAQTKFRQRQAVAKHKMNEENRRLKEALRSLAHSIGTGTAHKALATNSVQEALAIAGIDSEATCKCITSHSCSHDSSNEDALQIRPSFFVLPARLWRRDADRDRPKLIADPYQYLARTTPPPDMLPFIGQGAYSFAGRLFWSILEATMHAVQDIDLLEPAKPPEKALVTIKPRSGFHRVAERMTSTTNDRITYLAAMSEAQREHETRLDAEGGDTLSMLDLHKDGASSSWAWYSQLTQREIDSYDKIGHGPFLDLQAVESRVRRALGEDVFAVVSQAAIDSMKNKESGNSIIIKRLVAGLSNTFVCFGEGPRWEPLVLDAVLRSWLCSISTVTF